MDEETDSDDRDMAKYVAIVVRNAMEGFHGEHLSDQQMRELNPIIRNAVYTALHAARNTHTSKGAHMFVHFHKTLIPKYWEEPELLEDYLLLLHRYNTIPGDQA